MAGPEATIEREVCRRASMELGVPNIKLKDAAGFPDRLFLVPGGRPLMIEFKAPGAKPRKLQLYIHEQLRKLGYAVEVHDTVAGAVAAIKTHKEQSHG
jgi:hypothetical protein